MFKLCSVSKHFGIHRVFDDLTLELYPQEKVALIGPHGSGKSTLLRILAGIEPYQQGYVSAPDWTWVGYLPQTVSGTAQTVTDMLQSAREDYVRIKGNFRAAGQLPCLAGMDAPHPRYGLLECHASCGIGSRCRLMMIRLGIQYLPPSAKLMALTPGERKRLWLAGLLLANPDVLLLDEPTDTFDIMEIEWFERFLQSCKKTLVIASNDRALLERVSATVWEIDPDRHDVRRWENESHQPLRPTGRTRAISGTIAFPLKAAQPAH